jgi:ribosomal protein S18 acetylase RimI-like enzyme
MSYDGSFKPDHKIKHSRKKLQVKVREGIEKDVKPLANILHKSLSTDFETIQEAKECLEWWLKNPRYLIVAEYKASPIGVLLLSPEIFPVTDKRIGFLCFIAVKEDYRGRGVGTALVKEGCKVLHQDRKKALVVDVDAHDVQARIFYTKNGFYPYWYSRKYMPHDDGIFYRKDFKTNKT